MTPSERYLQACGREGFSDDPSQRAAIARLDELHARLSVPRAAPSGLRGWVRRWRREPVRPERGLYLWGGVGRGKTWMMDLFHDCLPFDDKLRMHFHRFMRRAHEELRAAAGQADPLSIAADRIAAEARVLCFDEFFVSDIGDAMILGELLSGLFARGVTLVATSNIEPRRLYENGLQRRRFLPAIALIEAHTEVVNVDGGIDHRLRTLEQAEIYHAPLDAAADEGLGRSFAALAVHAPVVGGSIEILGRAIPSRAIADDVAWFDFAALCAGPRSQNDYIELAREYHAVLVSGVPRFDARIDDQARRFISLVDEFYDHNVKLILSAEVGLDALYGGERLAFEFQRTVSRLREMQSREYLARTHRG